MTLVTEESSGGASRHLGQDVLCDGGKQKGQHLLVDGDPVAVERVGDVNLLLPFFSFIVAGGGLDRLVRWPSRRAPRTTARTCALP